MIVLNLATDAAVLAHHLTEGLPSRGIVDQLRRAADSVVLNLAESRTRLDGNGKKHLKIAHGSCQEAKAAVELLSRTGRMEAEGAGTLWKLLDRVGAMTWGLIR